jgi:hypothetical protein
LIVKIEVALICVLLEFFLVGMIVRRYQWTIAAHWYDPRSGSKREMETHFGAARSGSIRDNRRKLGRRGARYHQFMLFLRYGKFVPLSSLRVHFEKEKIARKTDKKIFVDARSMQYRGRNWTARALPSAQIPFWATKDERVFAHMRKDAEEREANRKKIRALLDKLAKDVKTT